MLKKKTSNHTKPSSATAAASEARNLILYMGRPTNQVYKRKNWSFWQGAIVHIDRRYIPNTYIRGFIYLCKLVTRLSSSSSKLKPDVVRPDANAGQVKPQWGQKLPKYAKNSQNTPKIHILKLYVFMMDFLKNFVPTFYFVSTLGILALSFVVDKAKWVQLNGKTLQVLKNSLGFSGFLMLNEGRNQNYVCKYSNYFI